MNTGTLFTLCWAWKLCQWTINQSQSIFVYIASVTIKLFLGAFQKPGASHPLPPPSVPEQVNAEWWPCWPMVGRRWQTCYFWRCEHTQMLNRGGLTRIGQCCVNVLSFSLKAVIFPQRDVFTNSQLVEATSGQPGSCCTIRQMPSPLL